MFIANCLTIIRILLTPVFIYFLLKPKICYPTGIAYLPGIIFSICVLTDFLDGLIARYQKSKAVLGTMLDPLADKILLLSAYIILTISNKIPLWLLLIISGRDILLVSSWLAIYIRTKSAKVSVRISGKIAIILQMTTVILVLFRLPLQSTFILITGFITALSALDYLINGIRLRLWLHRGEHIS